MSSKRLNRGGSIDYISGLPDCLICHILSFVTTKEAASTSVLAKRWRYLFALRPNLDFDDSIYLNPEKGRQKKITLRRKESSKTPRSFVDFVDRVLALHQHVPLNRFSLKCAGVVHPAIVIGWLLKVLERGVLDLDLDISSLQGYSLHPEIFVSETLVRLKLGVRYALTVDDNVKHVFLPKIRSLRLDHVMVKYSVFSKLLSGCQALEELVLDNLFGVRGSFSVSHNTLERLVVGYSDYFQEHRKNVSFCTPNLVYLVYSDTLADEYPRVDFSSLVEASIDLQIPSDLAQQDMDGNAANFLMGICTVKILSLSEYTLDVLTYRRKQTPVFNNLVHLTIKTCTEVSWESLPALLKNCPNLETLVFEGFNLQFDNCPEWDTSTFLSSNSVKILKILKFRGVIGDEYNEDQIKQIQLILEKMPKLEQLTIYYDTANEEDVYELLTQLQRHRRVASSKCKIQVISDDLCLSVTVPSSVTNKWCRLP